jgi:hypothetical protein
MAVANALFLRKLLAARIGRYLEKETGSVVSFSFR